MKAMRVGVATCAVLAAMSGVAHAELILLGGTPTASFTDIGGEGFGNAPRMLTLQTNGFESGFETPVDVEHGDAIDGANKSTTPTIGSLGWTSGSKVGIGFNTTQSGNTGITLDTLALTIYNGTTAVGTFSLGSPILFTAADLALQQGNGNAVFNFGLSATEQAQFNTIVAMSGSSGFFAGLSSSLGCQAGAPAGCLVSNAGPDSFLGFAQPGGVTTVPDGGSTLTLLGSALLAFGLLRRKLR
jgi:hypothetical protein